MWALPAVQRGADAYQVIKPHVLMIAYAHYQPAAFMLYGTKTAEQHRRAMCRPAIMPPLGVHLLFESVFGLAYTYS